MTDLSAQEISFSTDCETIYRCANDFNCSPSLVEFTATATTTCNTGGLAINYTIDLDDDGSVDESDSGSTINGNYPLGSHRVVFTATDDCANEAICEFLFLVEDCTAPIAMTFNGIAVETDSTQGVTLYASDMNLGSMDNCGISTMLLVSPSQGPGQTEPPIAAAPSIALSCDDLGTHSLDFWVGDAAGNWHYKSTYVLVQDNVAPYCLGNGSAITICLKSITECGESIYNVNYIGVQGAPGIPVLDFAIIPCQTFPFGSISTISPEKNINPLNGVSTFDMVLIARHILGIQFLDSPYKIIAADANHSGSVSTIDLIEIRKLILGIIPTFSNNTSWRFVDSSFVFSNSQNPFQSSFPEECSFPGVSGTISKTFIGMKIGDVNKSALFGDSLTTSEVAVRHDFSFDLIDQSFEAGELVKVDFYAEDMDDYAGFQFALAFDNEYLDFRDLKKGSLKNLDESNFGIQNDAGLIIGSWVSMDLDQEEKTSDALFSFQFTALQSGSLKDFIKLSTSSLSAEAYTHDLSLSNLSVHFSEAIPNLDFAIENTPNPFQESTTIRFELPQSDQVTLKIIDIKGSVIKTIHQVFEKGSNEIMLEGEVFPSNGVYFYQLETSNKSSTKKLMKIE